MNEVTPPNFCFAHSTSSWPSAGKSSLWMLLEWSLPWKTIWESLLTCKVEAKSISSLNTYSRNNHLHSKMYKPVFHPLLQQHRIEWVSFILIYICSHFVISNMFAHPSYSPLLLHPTLPLFSKQGPVKKKCLLWLSVHEPSCTTLLEPWSFLCFLSGARKWDLF